MERPRNPYQDNPFAILEMSSGASTRELVERARRLEKRIRAGSLEGDEARIIEARRRIDDPNQRIREELFCHIAGADQLRELEGWIARYATVPVELDPGGDWSGWQAWFSRLPLEAQADFVDPEPIRMPLLEQGERYEGLAAMVEAIGFAR